MKDELGRCVVIQIEPVVGRDDGVFSRAARYAELVSVGKGLPTDRVRQVVVGDSVVPSLARHPAVEVIEVAMDRPT